MAIVRLTETNCETIVFDGKFILMHSDRFVCDPTVYRAGKCEDNWVDIAYTDREPRDRENGVRIDHIAFVCDTEDEAKSVRAHVLNQDKARAIALADVEERYTAVLEAMLAKPEGA